MAKEKSLAAAGRIVNWANELNKQTAQTIQDENRLAATLINMAFPHITSPEYPNRLLTIDAIARELQKSEHITFINKNLHSVQETNGDPKGVYYKTENGQLEVSLFFREDAPAVYEWLGSVATTRALAMQEEVHRINNELPALLEDLRKVPDISIDGNTVKVIRANRQPEIT